VKLKAFALQSDVPLAPSVVRLIHASGQVSCRKVPRHEARQVVHAMRVYGTGWQQRPPRPIVSIANVDPRLTLVSPITGIAKVHKRPQAGEDFAPVIDPVDRQAVCLFDELR
jgi:hypothetical protein